MPGNGPKGAPRTHPSGVWYDLPASLAVTSEQGEEVRLAPAAGGTGEITLLLRQIPGIDPFAAALDAAVAGVIGKQFPPLAYDGPKLRKRSLYRGVCYRGDARKRNVPVAVTLYVVVLPGHFALAVYERPQGDASQSQALLDLALSLRSTEKPPAPGDALAAATRADRVVTLGRRAMDSRFQTFLCHNSQDKPAVRQLRAALEAAGIVTWMDEKRIRAGAAFVAELETALREMYAIVVALGPHGLGGWQELEYGTALGLYVDSRKKRARPLPLIPVILPGGPQPEAWPLFIRGFHGVDLAAGTGVAAAVELLVAGILGDPSFRSAATEAAG